MYTGKFCAGRFLVPAVSACCLLIASSNAIAGNISTTVQSEISELSLGDLLDASGPMLIVPSGDALFVGNYTSPGLVQFAISNNGELSFLNATDLTDLSAGLNSVRKLTSSSDGRFLYAAGEHRLAVLTYNQNSDQLSLVADVEIDPLLSTVSLALSPDDRHLYVVSNNYSFETNSGASALRRYDINSTTGLPDLVATRTEPASSAPLSKISFANPNDLAFVGRRTQLEVSRRNSASGELVLLAVNDGVSGGVVTADGGWLYESKDGEFSGYRVNGVSGELVRIQQFRTAIPPLRRFEGGLLGGDIALSLNEDRLFTTSFKLIGASIRSFGLESRDVFVRNPETGLLRRDGTAVRPGSSMVRHPANDWFYTFVPAFQNNDRFLLIAPVITQQVLLPPLPETRILSAVLPGSRSESNREEGVSAFATILNTGSTDAIACSSGILREPLTELNYVFFPLDPVTDQPQGAGATEFDIPAGGATNLLLKFNAPIGNEEFSRTPQVLDVRFFCDNAPISDRVTGVTTFGFASDPTGLPDLLVASASPDRPGIVTLPTVTGQSFFTVAAINLGAAASITARGAVELAGTIAGVDPLANLPAARLLICETDQSTSQCKAPLAAQVERVIDQDEIVTYTVVVQGLGSNIEFHPETNRAFVLFQDSDQHLRGSSSVALETR